jgi:hypothetical protein
MDENVDSVALTSAVAIAASAWLITVLNEYSSNSSSFDDSKRDIAAFWRILSVYDNYQLKKNENELTTLAEIGGKEKMDRSELEKISIIEKEDHAAENIRISKAVYRDLTWANDLILNVELGLFPKHR